MTRKRSISTKRIAATLVLAFASSLSGGCAIFGTPRASSLPLDCMEREEFRTAWLVLMLEGHPVEAEALFDLQSDCMSAMGEDVDDWL